jgi:hypothetical protein
VYLWEMAWSHHAEGLVDPRFADPKVQAQKRLF